jgi:hypothetical protein
MSGCKVVSRCSHGSVVSFVWSVACPSILKDHISQHFKVEDSAAREKDYFDESYEACNEDIYNIP